MCFLTLSWATRTLWTSCMPITSSRKARAPSYSNKASSTFLFGRDVNFVIDFKLSSNLWGSSISLDSVLSLRQMFDQFIKMRLHTWLFPQHSMLCHFLLRLVTFPLISWYERKLKIRLITSGGSWSNFDTSLKFWSVVNMRLDLIGFASTMYNIFTLI